MLPWRKTSGAQRTQGSKHLKQVVLAAALSVGLTGVGAAQELRVEAAPEPAHAVTLPMHIVGRVKVTRAGADQVLEYQWPGTYFEASFKGKVLFLHTGMGRQRLRLTVDTQSALSFVSTGGTTYRVAGLASGKHRVVVQVVNESQAGPDSFAGFAVPGKAVLPPPPQRSRQVEFIGDSYTVGYGNTSPKRTCTDEEVWATTDDAQAFGPLMAQAYGAEYQVNAISGRGVVRNYDGSRGPTLPEQYPYVLLNKDEPYSDANWRPQVIVLGLGTNDFSTALNPGEPWATRDALHADYEKTLLHFLQVLRERDPMALVILWATDGAGGEIQAEMRKVADHWKAQGETRVVFVPVNGLQMNGCHSHPSTADDQTIAARLRVVIEARADVWTQAKK